MEKVPKQQKRQLFAFDFSRPWAEALRDVHHKYYSDEASATALVRQVVQDFISCHYTEDEMRARGLVASYRSKPAPELIQNAIAFAEKMSKKGK